MKSDPVPVPGQRARNTEALERSAERDADRAMAVAAQTRTGPRAAQLGETPRALLTAGSGGSPLPGATRALFEPVYGFDFGRVRVHTGERAAQSANALNAQAYTVGANIVFDTHRYAPDSNAGKRLLAHELAHVVQQSTGPSMLQRQPNTQSDADALRELGRKMDQDFADAGENLEIVRNRLELTVGPPASVNVRVSEDTARIVEALIESSPSLEPYLFGKLAKTSVAKGFNIYDFDETFQHEVTKRDGPAGKPFSHTSGRNEARVRGFYDRATDSIHLPPTAELGDALHEGLHKYSSVGIQNALGIFINEGFTQHFADQVQADHSLPGQTHHDYGQQLECAKTVLGWSTEDQAARAYFRGVVPPLADTIVRRLRIPLGQLHALASDREGLGLCERIKAAH